MMLLLWNLLTWQSGLSMDLTMTDGVNVDLEM